MISKYLFIFVVFCIFIDTKTSGSEKDNVEKLNWDGLDVTWIKDEKLPIFNVVFYFADGAFSDENGVKGESNFMLSNLDIGTRRFNQKEIADTLEYYGISYSSYMSHEYSTFSYSGLMKDFVPTAKMICHLFKDSSFPKKEIIKTVKRIINKKNNLISSHSTLSSIVFREESLKKSPYYYPTSGKIKDINKIKQVNLLKKLNYFNNSVYKKVYISGPKDVLNLKNIVLKDCGWNIKTSKYKRSLVYKANHSNKPEYYFVPVKNATQAQVRIGTFLKRDQFLSLESLELGGNFLGGGFTSRLMREVRVKRGLSYGISAFIARQKDYGRAVISTYTDNKNILELIEVIKETVENVQKGKFESKDLETARGLLSGSFPFRFETNSNYINQVLYMEHIGQPVSNIYLFPKNLSKITKSEVSALTKNIFDWNKQTILVLGDKSILKVLNKKIGKFKVLNYKDYL